VLIRLFFNRKNEHLFTFEEISDMLGYADRRNVDNFYREFKQKGCNFLTLLSRKSELSQYVDDIQKVLLEHPFLSLEECYQIFKSKRPKANLCFESFKKYVSQTNTSLYIQNIHKHIEKGKSTWNNEHMANYLIDNIDNDIVKKKIENMSNTNPKTVPEAPQSRISLSTQNKSFLAKFLVGSGLCYAIIALIMGISKSYVNKLVYKEPCFNQTLLSSIDKYSGEICVDEKYVKLHGKFLYVFSAVDKKTGIPLFVELIHEKTALSWKAFFTVFKTHYGTPKLIVTDGCPALESGRMSVFPKVRHQYCKFHKMKNLIKLIFENEKDNKMVKKMITKLKQVFNRYTVGGRKKALLELEDMIPQNTKEYFEVYIKQKWRQLTQSLTTNSAERWNRKIKKIVSGKYGLKHPETIKHIINCLWFKELIVKGRQHLGQEARITDIKIPQICQELSLNKNMERLFNVDTMRMAS